MRLMLAVLLILGVSGISGQANARDKDGGSIIISVANCSEYLDSYSTSSPLDGGFTGDAIAHRVFGYIDGYLSAYNRYADNGKANIADGLSHSDVRRWVASWCRDNYSRSLHHALDAFVQSRLSR